MGVYGFRRTCTLKVINLADSCSVHSTFKTFIVISKKTLKGHRTNWYSIRLCFYLKQHLICKICSIYNICNLLQFVTFLNTARVTNHNYHELVRVKRRSKMFNTNNLVVILPTRHRTSRHMFPLVISATFSSSKILKKFSYMFFSHSERENIIATFVMTLLAGNQVYFGSSEVIFIRIAHSYSH